MNTKQQIYDMLAKSGMTRAGALGVLGNLQDESGCEPCRLQGDYALGRTKSKEYAKMVDTGEISAHIFAGDQQGWGIYQLSYHTRKSGYLAFVKACGASIADLEPQVKYMLQELREQYKGLWKMLCSTSEIYTATARFCAEFERPAINNIQARYAMALAIEAELEHPADPQPAASEYWPPRMIDKGMSGPDVEVLQAVLKARGYGINYIGGKFDELLDQEVQRFQKDHNLKMDGVAGPKTWAAILSSEA